MNINKLIFSILSTFFGVFMVLYGGMDDSPGAQGIGVVAITIGVLIFIKSRNKS